MDVQMRSRLVFFGSAVGTALSLSMIFTSFQAFLPLSQRYSASSTNNRVPDGRGSRDSLSQVSDGSRAFEELNPQQIYPSPGDANGLSKTLKTERDIDNILSNPTKRKLSSNEKKIEKLSDEVNTLSDQLDDERTENSQLAAAINKLATKDDALENANKSKIDDLNNEIKILSSVIEKLQVQSYNQSEMIFKIIGIVIGIVSSVGVIWGTYVSHKAHRLQLNKYNSENGDIISNSSTVER